MLFTRKEDYGVLVMKKLAKHYDKGWLPLSKIALKSKLPLPFLKQIMIDLKKARLVSSKEGVKGGYKLRINPKDISLGQIIRAFRGPISVAQCLSEDEKTKTCPFESTCPSKNAFKKAGSSFIDQLDKTKLIP